jgi:hypothetical protein
LVIARLLSVSSFFLSFLTLVYLLYNRKIKVLIYVAVHSGRGKVLQCEILLGSVEKCIEVCLTAGKYLNPLPPIKMEKSRSG